MRLALLLCLVMAAPALADDPLLNLREARKTQRVTRKHLPGLGLTRPLRSAGLLSDNSRKSLSRYSSRSRDAHGLRKRR